MRGLTTGFAGFFAGGTAIFPVRAMGYELCGMRMERSAVGKGKGGDFVGERGRRLGWCERYRDPSRSKDALRMTA